MQGFQITFFTRLDHKHGNDMLSEWLMLAARDLGIHGATIFAASEGFGRDKKIHAGHFFELGDQPQEIVVTASEEQTAKLFSLLKAEQVDISYIKTPVEFGTTSEY
ncbi:DUF190 domain-containing protein [Methylophilus sp.]|uniref:DUF190 domain-containing protein n=1 Tax=Methylophilus sp. TaxID=29541 RepID=UPI004036F715